MTTKAERAIKACREAADALEALPIRRVSVLGLGPMVSVESLRTEADWIERQASAWSAATVEVAS